jgi:large subunit ribosomal protein L35
MAQPKQKTHKGASKRFKVTAGGKILHRSHKLRHNRSKKSKKQIRSLKTLKSTEGKIKRNIQRLLGIK